MGIFWETDTSQPPAMLVSSIADALQSPPPDSHEALATEATQRAKLAAGAKPPTTFNAGRFVMALVIVGVLLAAAILCEANGWKDAEKTLLSLATTAFGIVTGLLGGKA